MIGRNKTAFRGRKDEKPANLTYWSPVLMYGVLKLTDFVTTAAARLWLEKEMRVKN